MSYSTALTYRNIAYFRNPAKRGRNRERILSGLLILLIFLSGVLYIIQANSVATGGYKIQKYKNEIAKLQLENQGFGLKLSEVRSPKFLEEKIKSLNMVKIGKVEYLSPVSWVAAR